MGADDVLTGIFDLLKEYQEDKQDENKDTKEEDVKTETKEENKEVEGKNNFSNSVEESLKDILLKAIESTKEEKQEESKEVEEVEETKEVEDDKDGKDVEEKKEIKEDEEVNNEPTLEEHIQNVIDMNNKLNNEIRGMKLAVGLGISEEEAVKKISMYKDDLSVEDIIKDLKTVNNTEVKEKGQDISSSVGKQVVVDSTDSLSMLTNKLMNSSLTDIQGGSIR